MKILSGKYKGRNFYMPAEIRPTQNKIRKSVFDLLGNDLSGLDFLDLFAGSGAMGLEALSLGARSVTFVENSPKCADVIRANLERFKVPWAGGQAGLAEVLEADAFSSMKLFFKQMRKFDVIFADPPYERELAKKLLKTANACDILHPNALLIVECGLRENLPDVEGRFSLLTLRKYGKTKLAVIQVGPESVE